MGLVENLGIKKFQKLLMTFKLSAEDPAIFKMVQSYSLEFFEYKNQFFKKG